MATPNHCFYHWSAITWMILGYPHLGNIPDSHHGRAGHQGTAIKVALATQGMRKHKNPGEGREDDAPTTRRAKNMGNGLRKMGNSQNQWDWILQSNDLDLVRIPPSLGQLHIGNIRDKTNHLWSGHLMECATHGDTRVLVIHFMGILHIMATSNGWESRENPGVQLVDLSENNPWSMVKYDIVQVTNCHHLPTGIWLVVQ